MTSLGRKKTESNCLANFPRTISRTSSLFRQSQYKRKLEARTKSILDKCSDVTCTKQYALTEGPRRGWGEGANVGHSLSPPSHFMFATQDEVTRTCAWDAKDFIAKKNIRLYYFHCNDRDFKPAVLGASSCRASSYFKQGMLQMQVNMG